MSRNMRGFVWRIGYITLVVSGFVLLLFAMNVRSRIYYHGPNYSFLFWIFLYSAITGIGLLRFKKWAAVLLLVPGICVTALFIYAVFVRGAHLQMPWGLLNVVFAGILLAIPIFILRHWSELPQSLR